MNSSGRSGSTSEPTGTRTVAVAAPRVHRWLDNFAERHGSLVDIAAGDSPAELRVCATDAAVAVLALPAYAAPVEPIRGTRAFAAAAVEPVRLAVLLVRRGGWGVAVAVGNPGRLTLESSKVGRRRVQGRTKAGGWSQQRFARRRANQAGQVFDDAYEEAASRLRGEVGSLHALVTGGDRPALAEIIGRLDEMQGLRGLVALPRVEVAVPGDPRERDLLPAAEAATAVTVHLTDPPA